MLIRNSNGTGEGIKMKLSGLVEWMLESGLREGGDNPPCSF
jgi:hypothetical protein